MCTGQGEDEQQQAGQQAHGGDQDVEKKSKVIGRSQLVRTRFHAHPGLGSSSRRLEDTSRRVHGHQNKSVWVITSSSAAAAAGVYQSEEPVCLCDVTTGSGLLGSWLS